MGRQSSCRGRFLPRLSLGMRLLLGTFPPLGIRTVNFSRDPLAFLFSTVLAHAHFPGFKDVKSRARVSGLFLNLLCLFHWHGHYRKLPHTFLSPMSVAILPQCHDSALCSRVASAAMWSRRMGSARAHVGPIVRFCERFAHTWGWLAKGLCS